MYNRVRSRFYFPIAFSRSPNPGVFTELIESFGAKGLQVEELYALDDSLLEQLKFVTVAY